MKPSVRVELHYYGDWGEVATHHANAFAWLKSEGFKPWSTGPEPSRVSLGAWAKIALQGDFTEEDLKRIAPVLDPPAHGASSDVL